MTDMPTAPAHARNAARRPEGLIAAWLCMIIAGVTTVTFNIWHAFHSAMAWPVATLVGLAPVALAMVVSHLVAVSRAGRFLKAVTFAVMLGAMALSVRATGAVVSPAFGDLWWLFGAVIDTGALVALQVLLALKAKAARDEVQRAADEAAATDERTALRAELGALNMERDGERQSLLSDLEAARNAREDAENRVGELVAKVEILTRKLEAAKPRKAPRKPAPQRAPAGTRRPPRSEAPADPAETSAGDPATEVPNDVDAQAEALAILADEPDISGAKLAERVGMSERWGQTLKKNLAARTAGPDGPSGPA